MERSAREGGLGVSPSVRRPPLAGDRPKPIRIVHLGNIKVTESRTPDARRINRALGTFYFAC